MIRHKWSVGLRNKLASLANEVDSCAAIEGAKLTKQERAEIKEALVKVVNYIDNKISEKYNSLQSAVLSLGGEI